MVRLDVFPSRVKLNPFFCFNSNMVRLDVLFVPHLITFPLFQFQYGAIRCSSIDFFAWSTTSWFQFQYGAIRCWCRNSIDSRRDWGFNSNMVRLDAVGTGERLEFKNACFNSNMVRLDELMQMKLHLLHLCFNSNMVRLDDTEFLKTSGTTKFQFQYGAIRWF